jgi:tubulin-specific chaperone E
MSTNHRLGQRLSYNGVLCTVRYIGNVAGTKGTWLGVEWDNPSRGKHNGSYQGVKYFSCTETNPPSSLLRGIYLISL